MLLASVPLIWLVRTAGALAFTASTALLWRVLQLPPIAPSIPSVNMCQVPAWPLSGITGTYHEGKTGCTCEKSRSSLRLKVSVG